MRSQGSTAGGTTVPGNYAERGTREPGVDRQADEAADAME